MATRAQEDAYPTSHPSSTQRKGLPLKPLQEKLHPQEEARFPLAQEGEGALIEESEDVGDVANDST